jgi:hypothetical protein
LLYSEIQKPIEICIKKYITGEPISHPYFVGLDEHGVTNALTMTFFDKLNEKMNWSIDNFFTRWLKKWKTKRLYLVEQYTTPFHCRALARWKRK